MKRVNPLLFVSLLTLASVSCGTSEKAPEKQTPEYAAMKIDTTSALIATDFAAELQSAQVVEVRPRVTGYLDKILVEEGSSVRRGDVIFQINEDELRATYNAALANVEAAEAAVISAQLEVEKLTPLVAKNIISEYELQSAVATLNATKAQKEAAAQQAKNAKISLSYTTIVSPVNGVVGRIVVRSGTLVSPSSSDALTTVSSSGPVSAYFSINENLVLDIIDKTKSSDTDLKDLINLIPEATLVMSNGNIYPSTGKIELASGIIDMTTGSAQLKAVFPNDKGVLRTGASAKVRINSPHSGVVVIPQSATYDLQDKIMVYKVGSDGTVKSQNLELYGITDTDYVVKSGLSIGDVIATEGLDYIKEGNVIKPKF